MNLLNAMLTAAVFTFGWLVCGMWLFQRVWPITHRELMDKLERGTLERGTSRAVLRACLWLPALHVVSCLCMVGGTRFSSRVVSYLAVKLKLAY